MLANKISKGLGMYVWMYPDIQPYARKQNLIIDQAVHSFLIICNMTGWYGYVFL